VLKGCFCRQRIKSYELVTSPLGSTMLVWVSGSVQLFAQDPLVAGHYSISKRIPPVIAIDRTDSERWNNNV